MKQGYLARESERANKATRKTLIKAIIVLICAIAIIYFFGKDSINFSDISYGTISFYMVICIGIVLFGTLFKLFVTRRVAMNGKNLFLPYGENTKEVVGNIIDGEALEGKILVEEYLFEFADGKKAYGEKIVLMPSYLLLMGTSKVTAIPRDKIYWICAQVGYKGGPFRVKLLIFTENKIFSQIGVDIEHVQSIADKLYQYIPNIFSDYDPFVLSYELEKIFAKNFKEFLNFYENEKKKNIKRIEF